MDGFFYAKTLLLKNRLFVIYISCISFLAQTQVTRSDFKSLIPSLEKEDWKYVFKRSGALLEANPNGFLRNECDDGLNSFIFRYGTGQ